MVELKGSLTGIGLPAIVQLIGELHHSGSLELSKGAINGTLGFDDGRLVAASFGDRDGLAALSHVVLELADGEFRFVDGVALPEHTIDLSGPDLQRSLARIANGDSPFEHLDPFAPALEPEGAALAVCPRLGFADDPTRNYSRPTALHRCYASIAPSLVTVQEQRELCLGGGYASCPRFRNASRSSRRTATPAVTPRAVTGPERSLQAADQALTPSTSLEVPAGAGELVAATGQIQRGERALDAAPPGWQTDEPMESLPPPPGPRSRGTGRGILLAASGILVGLAVVVLVVLVALPSRNSPTAPRAANVAATQAFESVPPAAARTGTPFAVPPAGSTTRPTPAPSQAAVTVAGAQASPAVPLAAAQAPKPAAPAPGTAGQAPGVARASAVAIARPLLELRFASGAPPAWIDSLPFANWADGAYRLRALQSARFVAVAVPLNSVPDDVLVSATFRKTGGPPGGGYGLILRAAAPESLDAVNQTFDGYVFETGDQGEFGVWRRDADRWIDLVPWTRSAAVRLGGSPNELVVRASGDRLVFTVNGIEVANVQDDVLTEGAIGLFAGGDYNEVALDRFAVQALN